MGEDLKQKDPGPEGARQKMPLAIPDTEDDTEGHKH